MHDSTLPNVIAILALVSGAAAIAFFIWYSTWDSTKKKEAARNELAQYGAIQANAQPVSPKQILVCPECKQKLRVPMDRGKLVVHCPKCSHSWGWSPDQRFEEAIVHFRATTCPRCQGAHFSLFRQKTLVLIACLRCCGVLSQCPHCHTMMEAPMANDRSITCPRCKETWEPASTRTAPTRCGKCNSTTINLYLDASPPFAACDACDETWDLHASQAPTTPADAETNIRRSTG